MTKYGSPLDWALALTIPEPNSGCLLWLGALDKDGYGKFKLPAVGDGKRRHVRPHRWLYEQIKGPIPEGYEPDHKCKVRCCCNWDHLEIVTQQENCRRAGILGGGGRYQRAKTHCPDGHEYAGHNLIIFKSGSRACRICMYRRIREQKQGLRNAS